MITSLEGMRQEWQLLFDNSPTRSLFQSFEYVSLWYNCFSNPSEIRILKAESDQTTVAILPLVLTKRRTLTYLKGLTNPHCQLASPLVRKGYEELAARLLLEQLRQSDSDKWDVLEQSPIFSFDPPGHLLTGDTIASQGLDSQRYDQPTYSISLEGSYEKYLKEVLGTKYVSNLKNRSNRLRKAGESEFLRFRDWEAVDHLEEFLSIEDSGWKGERGSSILKRGGELLRFYREFADFLASQKALHIYFLKLDDIYIAGRLAFADRNTLHFFKTGYREEFRSFSPSSLLLADILKQLMSQERKFARVHLFPDNDEHKQRWSNSPATASSLVIYNRSCGGRMASLGNSVRQSLKKVTAITNAVRLLRSLGGRR
jgi:CelD/BcsL family acetyltransferase involved in cellulose biosynthesis